MHDTLDLCATQGLHFLAAVRLLAWRLYFQNSKPESGQRRRKLPLIFATPGEEDRRLCYVCSTVETSRSADSVHFCPLAFLAPLPPTLRRTDPPRLENFLPSPC